MNPPTTKLAAMGLVIEFSKNKADGAVFPFAALAVQTSC